MKTVADPVPEARKGAAGSPRGSTGGVLTGTGTLLRFALRRDRVRIPVWVLALGISTLATANSFAQLYPESADRAATARTMGSPAALAMTGPEGYLDDYTFGAMLSHQMIGFVGVVVGLMSVLIVVRHTRAEEETGRAELVRSAVVGRHAPLTAALLAALVANAALALLLALGLAGMGVEGVTAGGALLYGLAHAGVGLVFAALAAVTVQITAYARGASGMALAVIGLAYALRAAGDAGGSEGGEFLSWISPIGWAQRTYPFAGDHWAPLLLFAVVTVVLCWAAYLLSTRRDVGAGLRASRQGRARATAALARPFGFALRLQRGVLIGFAAALFLLGAMYGSILGQVGKMLENVDALDEAIARAGGASFEESFASIVMVVVAILASIHVVMAALRPRAEETAGRAEPLLATALSRSRWAGSHLAVALVGGTLTLLLAGLGFGIAGAASAGDAGLIVSLTTAALAYAPALWVTAGFAMLLFGWAPRATAAAWLIPVYAFVVGYLGQILQFPGWLNNLSPFGHVPQLPAQDMSWTPMVVLTLVAAALAAAGFAGLRRRDIETK